MASNQSTRSSLSEPAPVSTEKVSAALAEMVVFVDGRTEAAGILEFAGVLAQEHGSHLTAVFMQPDPAATSPSCSRIPQLPRRRCSLGAKAC